MHVMAVCCLHITLAGILHVLNALWCHVLQKLSSTCLFKIPTTLLDSKIGQLHKKVISKQHIPCCNVSMNKIILCQKLLQVRQKE